MIDDTGTMQLPTKGHYSKMPKHYTGRTRWGLICQSLEYLTTVVQQKDNKVDLCFLINKKYDKRNVKDCQSLLNQLDKIKVKESRGGTYLEPVLNRILKKYIEKLQNPQGNEDVRPLDVIIFTDSVALDRTATEKLLLQTADKLEMMEAPQNQVGIQFVQVGEDKNAAEWMKKLYEGHKLQSKRGVRFWFSLSLVLLKSQNHCSLPTVYID